MVLQTFAFSTNGQQHIFRWKELYFGEHLYVLKSLFFMSFMSFTNLLLHSVIDVSPIAAIE